MVAIVVGVGGRARGVCRCVRRGAWGAGARGARVREGRGARGTTMVCELVWVEYRGLRVRTRRACVVITGATPRICAYRILLTFVIPSLLHYF
jgi:hypothetical protein